jgi:hypothetical protein
MDYICVHMHMGVHPTVRPANPVCLKQTHGTIFVHTAQYRKYCYIVHTPFSWSESKLSQPLLERNPTLVLLEIQMEKQWPAINGHGGIYISQSRI